MRSPEPHPIDRIDRCLPQTQCTQCGYPRCLDYARAIAAGEADINQCPPGGETTIAALARLLGRAVKPLDPAFGATRPRTRAHIDEETCIGCAKCLPACPVDAIVGARKLMHTVVAELCTGCELCLPPCPVDCIHFDSHDAARSGAWDQYGNVEVERWRAAAAGHFARLAQKQKAYSPKRFKRSASAGPKPDSKQIRREIAEAVERVRQKRRGFAPK